MAFGLISICGTLNYLVAEKLLGTEVVAQQLMTVQTGRKYNIVDRETAIMCSSLAVN